jgi:pyruvate dehydrogenase E1 component alpha subunit
MTAHADKVHLDRDHLLHLMREMLRIRRFEERCVELYSATKIRGFLHLYIGEEANAVGVMQALTPNDAVVTTYREHGHALARGIAARPLMAEMYGKIEGTSRGRGGSMHVFDKATRFYGGNAIVGGGLPLAVGIALADKMRGEHTITACFFGDGAASEGVFHESLNLAELWKLPVLFVCENNRYAMGTAVERAQAQIDFTKHAASYAIRAEAVDGMDVVAVEIAARRAAAFVRESGEPYFLENRTYRFRAHSMYDPDLYRSKAEIEEWKKRDPIPFLEAWMRNTGALHADDLPRIEAEIAAEIDDAVTFAEAGHWEPVEDLCRDVMTPRGVEKKEAAA